jgi:hypothetical protein
MSIGFGLVTIAIAAKVRDHNAELAGKGRGNLMPHITGLWITMKQ